MEKTPANTPAAARSSPSTKRRKRSPLPRHVESRQRRLAATIGTVAKQARTRAGLTQAEVAAAIGTHPEVYGRMERGEMTPSVPTLMRLCLALGSGPHELMGFAPMAPQAPGASTVPPGLKDTPEERRLLRLLARLNRPRLRVVLRLVALLVPGR